MLNDTTATEPAAQKRGRGRPKLESPPEERHARAAELSAARAARVRASAPGPLATLPDETCICYDQLAVVAGINYSRSHINLLARKKVFPAPVRIGPNRVAWLARDLRKYLAEVRHDR